MKLIVAQGNPEAKYTNTRHNVGFQMLDHYAAKHNTSFVSRPKFSADIAELKQDNEKVLLIKPTTYYNETGRSVRALTDFYKVDPEHDVLVVHDDIALQFGIIRTRAKGSDAGNNGIKSLNSHIGDRYNRIRIGILTELANKIDTATFVLSNFNKDEQALLRKHVEPTVSTIIDTFIANSFQTTSHAPVID